MDLEFVVLRDVGSCRLQTTHIGSMTKLSLCIATNDLKSRRRLIKQFTLLVVALIAQGCHKHAVMY